MSADWILGEPFNIASYAFLTYIVCELVNNDENFKGEKLIPGKLFISFGDVHVYEQHLDVAYEQIKRRPYPFPKIKFNKKISRIEELNFSDIELLNYECHATLSAQMVA